MHFGGLDKKILFDESFHRLSTITIIHPDSVKLILDAVFNMGTCAVI